MSEYEWQLSYFAAICETDNAKMAGRILDARSAMEQRLLSPIDEKERHAIKKAAKDLEALRAERADPTRTSTNEDETA
jgi:hypothetical protein